MSLSACRRLRPGRRGSPSARHRAGPQHTGGIAHTVAGPDCHRHAGLHLRRPGGLCPAILPAKPCRQNPLKSFGPDARGQCAGVLLPLPEARPESVDAGHDAAGLPGRGATVCGRIVGAGPGVAAVSGGAGAAGRCGGLVPGLGNILLRSCHGPWR